MNLSLIILLLVQEAGRMEEEDREKLAYLFHCYPSSTTKSKDGILFLKLNFFFQVLEKYCDVSLFFL